MKKINTPWIFANQNEVVLKKFKGYETPGTIIDCPAELKRKGLIVDLETTGLDKSKSKIIEIALRNFSFNRKSGEVVEIGESFSALEDPKEPLSTIIKQITGIADSELKGKAIDWARAEKFIKESDLIIAHNASFDRGFLDAKLDVSKTKIWGCSLTQINWLSKGFTKSSLEMLAAYHGFYYAAHRALIDVDVCLKLISMKPFDKPYLLEILEEAKVKRAILRVYNTAYETKNFFSQRGYRWQAQTDKIDKNWWKSIAKDKVEEEEALLRKEVFRERTKLEITQVPLTSNFSSL